MFWKKHKVNNTLYVIVTVFNPRGYESRYRLYNEFKKYISHEPNVKLLTVEIAFQDRPFEVTSPFDAWDLRLRTSHDMWHKERAINLGFKHLLKLVPKAKYIGWFDPDIKFTNPNWATDTIKALHHFSVVQPFSEAQNLNPKYESQWKTPSALKHYQDKLGFYQSPKIASRYLCGGHPGLAWAARRDVFEKLGGLADFCVAGSGDTHMLNALMGDVTLFYKQGMTQAFKDALQEWAERADLYVRGNIGYVNGICYHYWHGKSEKRGYEKRWDIINFHQFDPKQDIFLERNGLYGFNGNKPELVYDLRKSMSGRNEDGIDE